MTTEEQNPLTNAAGAVPIDSERTLVDLFAVRNLPRSYHWLYRRSDDYTQAHLPSVIDGLCDQGMIAGNGDGTWSRQDGAGGVNQGAGQQVNGDGRGVVRNWEEMLFAALQRRNAHVALHRFEYGYDLALALTAFAARLDVEIDGAQHQLLVSQRAKDITRDQRLRACGWSVLRLTVSEVIANLDATCDKVMAVWNRLKDGGEIE